MQIAPNFTVEEWKELGLSLPNSGNWLEAIKQFRLRIESRFIKPADILISAYEADNSVRVGFAVLAIDFIVIETLQGFKEGHIEHKKTRKRDDGSEKEIFLSKALVKTFLKNHSEFEDISNENILNLEDFYQFVRCNLTHMGQTKGDILIRADRADGPLLYKESDSVVCLNRTAFHESVKSTFERYCEKLKNPSDRKLRENFLKKMNAICGIPS